VLAYESVLQNNPELLQDQFIAENIDEVSRAMRLKGVLKFVMPYRRFHLSLVSRKLRIRVPEARNIIGFLILDGRVNGTIDDQTGVVEIERQGGDVLPADELSTRADALDSLADAYDSLWNAVFEEVEGYKVEDSQMAVAGAPGVMPGVTDWTADVTEVVNPFARTYPLGRHLGR